MLKKLLNGFIFGTGFALALILVFVIYFKYFFSETFDNHVSSSEPITEVPNINKPERGFLGSPAIYSGGFPSINNKVLTNGPGSIIGKASINDMPLEGLKLRLALNGEVMSQWATTNSEGEYSISVPFGEYKIDGYELNSKIANNVLSGYINSPQNAHSSDIFSVSDKVSGIGLHMKFVEPVIKSIRKNLFTLDEPIMIEWEAYPKAALYRIQVYEKENPHEFNVNNSLFAWSDQPSIVDTSVDLKTLSDKLKNGSYYSYEVKALGNNGQIISESPKRYQGYDFRIKN